MSRKNLLLHFTIKKHRKQQGIFLFLNRKNIKLQKESAMEPERKSACGHKPAFPLSALRLAHSRINLQQKH